MQISYKNLGLFLLALGFAQAPLVIEAKEPPADLQPLEDIPPPPLVGEDGALAADALDEPQITIIKKKGETIEEYRINGELYMMKVTPDHGVPYYMHKEDQNGGWLMDGPNQPLSIPKWTIFRF